MCSSICFHKWLWVSVYVKTIVVGSNQENGKTIQSIYPYFFLSSLLLYFFFDKQINAKEFVLNAICISHSYNNHWWFIPMYFALLLLFPLLKKTIAIPVITLICLLFIKILGKFSLSEFDVYTGYGVYECFMCVLSALTGYMVVFYMGLLCAKDTTVSIVFNKYLEKIRTNKLWSIIVLFLAIVIADIVPYFGFLAFILVPIVIPAMLNITKGNVVRYLGDLSMYIWLSHYFLFKLIKDFLNSLGNFYIVFPTFIHLCIMLALVFKRLIRFDKSYI